MKFSKLVVIASAKNGTCYQVGLSKEEEWAIESLIFNLHQGKIKVFKGILPMKIKTRKEEAKNG